ncbi:MAG: hypothetical protein KatS3mg061_3026 [Dehalococcoidia bacterium]|nr:MAG: hypothetical protein KatS3mg061_3026 [Dehalococcoidia bacterium]
MVLAGPNGNWRGSPPFGDTAQSQKSRGRGRVAVLA